VIYFKRVINPKKIASLIITLPNLKKPKAESSFPKIEIKEYAVNKDIIKKKVKMDS
jgi:hypothetical protein